MNQRGIWMKVVAVACAAVAVTSTAVEAARELVGAADCSKATDCKSCTAMAGCHFCAGRLTWPGDKGPVVKDIFGVCAPDCQNVKFGDMSTLLKYEKDHFTPNLLYTVIEIDQKAPSCGDTKYPSSMAHPDCSHCVADKLGWCGIEIAAQGTYPALKGGICVPPGVEFLCNDIFSPVVGIPLTMNVKATVMKTTAQCGGTPVPLPTPSTTCEENLGCKTCLTSTSKCTWCAGVLTDEKDKGIMNVFGLCRTKKDCDKLSYDGIKKYMAPNSFTVKAVDDLKDALCTDVQWPTAFMQPCANCVSKKELGWCGLPGKSGVCMANDLSFACNVMSGAVTTKCNGGANATYSLAAFALAAIGLVYAA